MLDAVRIPDLPLSHPELHKSGTNTTAHSSVDDTSTDESEDDSEREAANTELEAEEWELVAQNDQAESAGTDGAPEGMMIEEDVSEPSLEFCGSATTTLGSRQTTLDPLQTERTKT